MSRALAASIVCVGLTLCAACGTDVGRCGPLQARVARVIDGDTVELEGGERVRYLLIDTPELSPEECYAATAREFNRDLVEGAEVTLRYGDECEDRFGRLLAFVSVGDGQGVNELLVEEGYACVLYIPPNGEDRLAEFEALEAAARDAGRGMWGACAEVPCAR